MNDLTPISFDINNIMKGCQNCGKCCKLEVFLSEKEILQIEEFTKKDKSEFTSIGYYKDIFQKLTLKRNFTKDNNCIFLEEHDGQYSCSIYKVRPQTCKDFGEHISHIKNYCLED